MTFMLDTRTRLVIRIERSHLAFAHQGRCLLEGGGSVTAWPLFIVCSDMHSTAYGVWSMVIERSITTHG